MVVSILYECAWLVDDIATVDNKQFIEFIWQSAVVASLRTVKINYLYIYHTSQARITCYNKFVVQDARQERSLRSSDL